MTLLVVTFTEGVTLKVSNLVLFAICMVTSCARFYIRIGVQKTFSIDDGVLLFGVCCLIAGMGLLLNFADQMFLVGATESGMPNIELPPDFIEQAFDYQKLVTVALILTWCAIVAVKFSYLFLFRKLIDRLPPMITYWWFVVVFNGIISAYGATIYIAACPNFYSLKSCECYLVIGSQNMLDIISSAMCIWQRRAKGNCLRYQSDGVGYHR